MTEWTKREPPGSSWSRGETRITLGPVTNLAAQSGDGFVTLTWSAASGSPWSVDAVADTMWHRRGDSPSVTPDISTVDVPSPVITYEIQRSDDRGLSWDELSSTDELTDTDTTVSNGSFYMYRVRATQYVSLHGDWSTAIGAWGVVTASPQDVTPPTQVIGLVTTGGIAQIVLTGYHATDNNAVTGYEIERDGALVAQTVASTYTDAGLVEHSTHSYRVRAFDAAGNRGAWSATSIATTLDVTAPVLGPLFKATASGSTVNLDWSDATDNVSVVSYEVQYSTSPDFSGASSVVPNPTSSSCAVTGLAGTYYFRYRAFDAAGNASGWSSTASALAWVYVDYTFASTYFVNADITALVA